MQEKRKYVRWQIKNPLCYKVEGSSLEKEALLKDISNGGAGILILEELSKDCLLDLVFGIPDRVNPISAQGKVVWQKEIGVEDRSQFATGVSFVRFRDVDKEKLYTYIRQNFPEELNRRWWQGLIN